MGSFGVALLLVAVFVFLICIKAGAFFVDATHTQAKRISTGVAVVKRDVEKRIAHIKNDTSIWKALDTSRVLVEKNVAAKERNASTFLQILRVQNPELRNLYVVRTSTKEVLYTFTPASTTYTQNKKYTFFESTGLPANIFQKGTLSRIVRNDSTGMYSVYVLQHSPTLTFTGFSIIQEISIDYFVQVLTSQKSITHLFENNFDIHNQGTTTLQHKRTSLLILKCRNA